MCPFTSLLTPLHHCQQHYLITNYFLLAYSATIYPANTKLWLAVSIYSVWLPLMMGTKSIYGDNGIYLLLLYCMYLLPLPPRAINPI